VGDGDPKSWEQRDWELRIGDILLARLTVFDSEFPWLYCRFDPTPDYAEVEPLFVHELYLFDHMDDSIRSWMEWGKAYDQIIDAGIELIPVESSKRLKGLTLHIEGDQAWFKGIFAGE
jgi:hypothetical protein